MDFYLFHWMFPPDTRKEDMWLCGREITVLCQDTNLSKMFLRWLLCLTGSFLVILGGSIQLVNLSLVRTRNGAELRAKEEHERIYLEQRVNNVLKRRPNAEIKALMAYQHWYGNGLSKCQMMKEIMVVFLSCCPLTEHQWNGFLVRNKSFSFVFNIEIYY